MKTKTYNFKEALNLYIETGYKPIPTTEKYQTYPDCREKSIERYVEGKFLGCVETIQVPIPEGRNPDELTIAHLQMGENGEACRLTENEEPMPEDAEYWDREHKRWQPTRTLWFGMTLRTRKPKGWWNKKIPCTKCKGFVGDCGCKHEPTAEQSSEVQKECKHTNANIVGNKASLTDPPQYDWECPDCKLQWRGTHNIQSSEAQPDLAQEFEEISPSKAYAGIDESLLLERIIVNQNNLNERLKRLEKGAE